MNTPKLIGASSFIMEVMFKATWAKLQIKLPVISGEQINRKRSHLTGRLF